MNKVVLCGRLVKDPEIRYSTGENAMAFGNYTLAVDRPFKRDGDQTADFIRCTVFNKRAEFAKNYLKKGVKLIVSGRIQTGSYKNKEGQTVYTTDVVVDEQEFAESKKASGDGSSSGSQYSSNDDFMNIPNGIDEEAPWADD